MKTEIIKDKTEMVNPLEAKESRADFRYVPLCSQLIDVICLPQFKNKEDYKLFDSVLKHYESTRN